MSIKSDEKYKKSYNTFTQKYKFDIIDKKCRRVICMIERIAKLT